MPKKTRSSTTPTVSHLELAEIAIQFTEKDRFRLLCLADLLENLATVMTDGQTGSAFDMHTFGAIIGPAAAQLKQFFDEINTRFDEAEQTERATGGTR